MSVDHLYPKKQTTMYQTVHDAILGKTNSKEENEVEYLTKQIEKLDRSYPNNHRLKQAKVQLEMIDQSVWVGSIYMDKTQEYNVIMDTATDLVMVNGHLCKNCPG